MPCLSCAFFFHDTPPTEIYTLSLHDALPILVERDHLLEPELLSLLLGQQRLPDHGVHRPRSGTGTPWSDRKSTRLNSSHSSISYAVFCLKKKNTNYEIVLANRDCILATTAPA